MYLLICVRYYIYNKSNKVSLTRFEIKFQHSKDNNTNYLSATS